jgi:hypothetical protein
LPIDGMEGVAGRDYSLLLKRSCVISFSDADRPMLVHGDWVTWPACMACKVGRQGVFPINVA